MKYAVAQVVVGLPVDGPFDYYIPAGRHECLSVGTRVLVPFGFQRLTGYVVGVKKKSAYKKLKPILSVLDYEPALSPALLALTKKVADYYCCSWGEAIECALPAALRHGRRLDVSFSPPPRHSRIKTPQHTLLWDMTSQGRWKYIAGYIQQAVSENRSVLVLVPDGAALAGATKRLAEQGIEGICAVSHGRVREELAQWIAMKRGEARVVVGARSAVFAPAVNMGLIVIIDEDNSAYKQEQSPFYHARDVALMRAESEKSRMLFVSAAPSVELWSLARRKKMTIVRRAAPAPAAIQLVDMTSFALRKGTILSFAVRAALQKALQENKKAIVFLNRRGFSTMVRCTQCGHAQVCPRCDVHLSYAFVQKKLICRLCRYTVERPSICPQCSGAYLRYTGIGAEKLESEIAREFPHARVSRFDRESTRLCGDAHIIIATQAILRLRECCSASVVVAAQIDAECTRLDFRSAHKTLSLLLQLRSMAQEKLIIQTRMPDNSCLQAIHKGDFERFYAQEMRLRRDACLPPAKHLLALTVRGSNKDAAEGYAQLVYREFCSRCGRARGVEALEPQPDAQPKLRGKYRFSIMVKAPAVATAVRIIRRALAAVKKKAGIHTSINVDP